MCPRGGKNATFRVVEESREVVAGAVVHRCSIPAEERAVVARSLMRLAEVVRQDDHQFMGFTLRQNTRTGGIEVITVSFCPRVGCAASKQH